MLFYRLWMNRWKTGSDIAHQRRKGLLRTSAVRPHSNCCCHSGQLVLETAPFGRTAWPCLVWKSKNFLMGMKSVLHEMICCLHLTVHIHRLRGCRRMITQTLELTHKGVSPQLVSHKDDSSFQQQRGKNAYHLSDTQAVEQTFKVHML